jgi:hypothetical protein
MTINDTINDIQADYEEKGWSSLVAALEAGGMGIILSVTEDVDDESSVSSIIVLDVSTAPEGPLVSIRAFAETGKPAELARLDFGALGQMLLHVRPT